MFIVYLKDAAFVEGVTETKKKFADRLCNLGHPESFCELWKKSFADP